MAPPDVETSDDRDEEWPAGYPVIGFKNLFRLAIASCVLAIPNFACQVYLADAIQYAGTKREDIKAVNSVWAYAVVRMIFSVQATYLPTLPDFPGKSRKTHIHPGIPGNL